MNLLNELSETLQAKLKMFNVTVVEIDECKEINIRSEYDFHQSYVAAIERELQAKGFDIVLSYQTGW